MTEGRASRIVCPMGTFRIYCVTILFLCLSLLTLAGCSREAKFKKEPVFYDLVENFPLAEVQQEVTLIDFGTPSAHPHMRSGWSMDAGSGGSSFVWSVGERSVLEFYLAEAREIPLVFRCSPLKFPGAPVQTISIAANGKEIQQVTLDPELREYQIVLPSDAVLAGKNRLEFRYAYARAPAEVIPGSTDTRPLAVAWGYIRFGTGEEQTRSEPRTDAEASELYIPFGAKVTYYLKLPKESAFALEGLRFTGSARGQVRLTLQREKGKEQVVKTLSTSEGFQSISLPTDSSEIVRLSFHAISPRQSSAGPGGATLIRPTILHKSSEDALWGSRRPNVIIYLIDALRPDHLGCYGYQKPVSPNIDAFAREAILFENAIAQAPWTRPSAASIFTGLSPITHGVNDIDDALPAEATTLAETLRAAGYKTAAFTDNNNIGFTFGFKQGFVHFFDMNEAHVNRFRLHETHKTRTYHQLSNRIQEHVFDWLEKEVHQQPFFLYVHTMEPHEPYAPPLNFRERFAAQVRNTEIGSSPWVRALVANKIPLTEKLIEDLIALYDAEIAFGDHNFGVFLKELKRRGLYEDALIILVSDHGEAFYEHDIFGHRNMLYKEVLNILLGVKFPSSSGIGSKKSLLLAQHIDILPTILDYLGLEIPNQLEGISLLSLVDSTDEKKSARAGFSYLAVGDRRLSSVIKDPWKLIRTGKAGVNDWHLELYNRKQDPGEKVNLVEKHPEVAEHLLSLMKAHEHRGRKLKPGKAVIDEELRERLKALGYVQ